MTPPRETLARLLARTAAEIRGLDGALLDHHVERFAPAWERRVPAILDAARRELAAELLRDLPIEPGYGGLDGPGVEPFVHDSPVEPA